MRCGARHEDAHERRNVLTVRCSAAISVAATGGAVLLCSYTTIVGYASLLFSQNKGIHTFGLSAMLGEFTCITAALVVAPALLDFGRPRAEDVPIPPVAEEPSSR